MKEEKKESTEFEKALGGFFTDAELGALRSLYVCDDYKSACKGMFPREVEALNGFLKPYADNPNNIPVVFNSNGFLIDYADDNPNDYPEAFKKFGKVIIEKALNNANVTEREKEFVLSVPEKEEEEEKEEVVPKMYVPGIGFVDPNNITQEQNLLYGALEASDKGRLEEFTAENYEDLKKINKEMLQGEKKEEDFAKSPYNLNNPKTEDPEREAAVEKLKNETLQKDSINTAIPQKDEKIHNGEKVAPKRQMRR